MTLGQLLNPCTLVSSAIATPRSVVTRNRYDTFTTAAGTQELPNKCQLQKSELDVGKNQSFSFVINLVRIGFLRVKLVFIDIFSPSMSWIFYRHWFIILIISTKKIRANIYNNTEKL